MQMPFSLARNAFKLIERQTAEEEEEGEEGEGRGRSSEESSDRPRSRTTKMEADRRHVERMRKLTRK
jgi:hypothetical protein